MQTEQSTISVTAGQGETKVWARAAQQTPEFQVDYEIQALILTKDVQPQLDDNLGCLTWSEKQKHGSLFPELLQRALQGPGLHDYTAGTEFLFPTSGVNFLSSFFWLLSA